MLVDGEPGTLRFLGHTLFADGLWAGVELARGIGKNDGSVGGRRYFFCQRGHGLFAPVSKVVRYDPAPPSPSPPPEPEMTPEPVLTPARRREGLSLPVGGSPKAGTSAVGGSSVSAAGAGAAALSPAGDLWWDNTEGSVGDQLDDVELLQDMELDELSLGILTPDQMDDDSHLLLRPDELSASLELLTSPDPEMAAAAAEQTFTLLPRPERVRLTSDEGAPLNVTVTISREPDWEDEFDAPSASAPTRDQSGYEPEPAPKPEPEPEPAAAAAMAEPMAPAEPAKPPPRAAVASENCVSDTRHSDGDSTFVGDPSGDGTPAGDVTASMSSESSDVTLKDESSGAGEALAEPPSPGTETLVLARPKAEAVADAGAAALLTGVQPASVTTETSAGAGGAGMAVKVCVVSDQAQGDSRDALKESQEHQKATLTVSESPAPERRKVSRPGHQGGGGGS